MTDLEYFVKAHIVMHSCNLFLFDPFTYITEHAMSNLIVLNMKPRLVRHGYIFISYILNLLRGLCNYKDYDQERSGEVMREYVRRVNNYMLFFIDLVLSHRFIHFRWNHSAINLMYILHMEIAYVVPVQAAPSFQLISHHHLGDCWINVSFDSSIFWWTFRISACVTRTVRPTIGSPLTDNIESMSHFESNTAISSIRHKYLSSMYMTSQHGSFWNLQNEIIR